MKSYFYDLRYKVDNEAWRARAKRDLVFRFWKKFQPENRKTADILDFGCGTGVLQEQFEKKFNVKAFGIDISKDAIMYCKKRGLSRVKVFDGKKITFENNSFDLVTAIDVMEHVKNDMYALREIKRVLKKNGLAILLVPAHPKLWSTRDIDLQHYRRYQVGELEGKCKKVGFKLLASKNVDFVVYFLFALLHKFAPRVKGLAQMGMDTESTNKILNEILFIYETFENRLQVFTTFPVGLSIAVVAQKT